jgi:hypothetical protein
LVSLSAIKRRKLSKTKQKSVAIGGTCEDKKRQRSTERWSDCDVTVVAGCWVVSPAIGDEIDGSYLWFSLSLSLSLRLLLLLSFFFVFS